MLGYSVSELALIAIFFVVVTAPTKVAALGAYIGAKLSGSKRPKDAGVASG